ncbi:MAG: rhomboid family intramembrane serine protease [Planctomycetota bacterium]|nr:MAG: rhomboid family intramembrane serine protease [Planctomycetota bacterium]
MEIVSRSSDSPAGTPEEGADSSPAKPSRGPFPWMTLLLFCVVTALFCLVGMDAGWSGETRGTGLTEPALESIDRLGGFFADDVENKRYYRLVTGTLFHPTWFEFILAAAVIFWSISRQVEKMCGPLTTCIAYVLGGAAGNAAIALTLSGGHTYIPSFGGVIFGLDGAMLGCLLRYRSVFPKEVFTSLLKGTLFWIALITILMFFAFSGTWHFLLDIPAGLFAGGVCGLLFPVRKLEREAPVGGTVLKYLCFAGVIAVLAGGFLSLEAGGGGGVSPGMPTFSSDEHVNKEAGFALRLPEGADIKTRKKDEKNVTNIVIKPGKFIMNITVTPSDESPEWVVSLAQENRNRRMRKLAKNETFSDVEFVNAMTRVLGGVEGYAYQIVYKEIIPPGTGKPDVTFIAWFEFNYLLIHRGKEYRIMFGSAEGEGIDNSGDDELRWKILESFRFLP